MRYRIVRQLEGKPVYEGRTWASRSYANLKMRELEKNKPGLYEVEELRGSLTKRRRASRFGKE
ncbi:MAG: hypothetical protein WBR26_21820 [Candidatus Acidiferrum sp.]